MKTNFSILPGALALLASATLPGCDRAETAGLTIGKPCTVQFRRDALGAAAANPISPLTNGINGADTSIAGTLKRVTAEWIVIGQHGTIDVWIPRSAVLLIAQSSVAP